VTNQALSFAIILELCFFLNLTGLDGDLQKVIKKTVGNCWSWSTFW